MELIISCLLANPTEVIFRLNRVIRVSVPSHPSDRTINTGKDGSENLETCDSSSTAENWK